MEIYLHDTLSDTKKTFEPITPGTVTMYNCGPTVYDYAHIGNLRSYVFADVLRRTFEYNGYTVTQVINITDIGHLTSDADSGEDKMSKALRREGKSMTLPAMREVADFYFEKFKDDLKALNIEMPAEFPFASDHISQDIDIIHILIDKGFTYNTTDGIYFDTAKFPEYGKLGNIPQTDTDPASVQDSGEAQHSRIGINPEKKNSRDFALWKFSGKFSDDLGYDAPFGKGFPGWHIECSAMSRKYLGQPFDIHTGGIDHIPVHHNNEIAQSECAYDTPLANIWMHNAFLNTGEAKMAKSGENFITLQTVKEKGIDPLALRYLFLTARYSSPIDFSWDALEGAGTAVKRLRKSFNDITKASPENLVKKIVYSEFREVFNNSINSDLDTPSAIETLWDVARSKNMIYEEKKKLMSDFDRVLGLQLDKPEQTFEIPGEVQKLIDKRDQARRDKNFELSDSLRKEIESLGFVVRDTDSGTELEKIRF